MIMDASSLVGLPPLRADVCIVGTGAAGMTAALELAERGHSVVVLEAGTKRFNETSQSDYQGVGASPVDHGELDGVRLRRLGGTTTIWGGRCAPLDPLDFTSRPGVPGSGWPFDRSTLDRYYQRAHQLCDLGAFDYGISALPPTSRARFFSPDDPTTDDTRIWRWGPPVNFWRRYGQALTQRPNVRVVYRAIVASLHRSQPGGPITRSVVIAAGGGRLEVVARVYVLAAGGLETTRLMLLSDEHDGGGLGNDAGLLGRHYMTHPVGESGALLFADRSVAVAGGLVMTRDAVYSRRILAVSAEHQAREGIQNLAASLWYPDPRDPAHGDPLLSAFALTRAGMAVLRTDWKSRNIQSRYAHIEGVRRHLWNLARGGPDVARFGADWVRRRLLASRRLPSFNVVPRAGFAMRLRFDAEQRPEFRNHVSLAETRDRHGLRRLRLDYRIGTEDRESIVRSLDILFQGLRHSGVVVNGFGSDGDLLSRPLGDGTHQMGLTRMADSPRNGVVDRYCRVHGVANLFVASSAVFPTAGVVGPTLTIVALAVRTAETVSAELRPTAVPRPGSA